MSPHPRYSFEKGVYFEGITPYVGAGTPTGLPGPTLDIQRNLITGDAFGTAGLGISDVLELGVYCEGDFSGGPVAQWDNTDKFISVSNASGSMYIQSSEDFSQRYDQTGAFQNQGYVSSKYYGTYVDVGWLFDIGPEGTDGHIWYDMNADGSGEFSAQYRGVIYPSMQEAIAAALKLKRDQERENHHEPEEPIVPPITNNNDDGDDGDDGDTAAVVVAPVEPTIDDIAGGNTTTSTGGGGYIYKPDPTGPVYTGDGTGANIPVILDLDGDGVEVVIGEEIYFDLDDDGFLEKTSWASADDGFLVIDRNADGTRGVGDGVIDQSNELVLSSLGQEGDTDLQALARYDLVINGGNGDGVLSAGDAIWNELKVWQDLNQDGKTEGDGTELKTLAAWGISSINLAYDDGTDFTDESNDVKVFGNILHGLALAA